MSSFGNLIQFQDAVCAALGIDAKKDRVVGIDIHLAPMAAVEVRITRFLLSDEGDKIVELLKGVDWQPKEAKV